MNTNQFNSGFWLSISGLIIGFLSGVIVFCLKSKCKTCSICFGLIKIVRDINGEILEEKNELEAGLDPYSFNNKK